MWGATQRMISDSTNTIISIHAPRVGSDLVEQYPELESKLFQSTLPVWGATKGKEEHTMGKLFQSTLPVWERRCSDFWLVCRYQRFNPRSPCGERLSKNGRVSGQSGFNPRSPCGERLARSGWTKFSAGFQSTLPVWGATGHGQHGGCHG